MLQCLNSKKLWSIIILEISVFFKKSNRGEKVQIIDHRTSGNFPCFWSTQVKTNRLEQRCWNHHGKSTAMSIHDRTLLSGNDEITRLNSDVTTTMNLVVVSSRVLHVLAYANIACRFAKLCTIMLKHDWTILLFYQSCSLMPVNTVVTVVEPTTQ